MCLNQSCRVIKKIALALCGCLAAAPLFAAQSLRIMVVGDSISVGYTDNPKWTVPFEFGFRSGLYTRLTNSGVAVQFVGSSREPWNGGSKGTYGIPTNTPTLDLRTLGQDQCEGYGGRKSAYVLANISAWLTSHSPDVVLLMIGINDIHAAAAEPVAPQQNLSNIVFTVTTQAPQARLVVAQITPYGTNCPGIVKYNAYIRTVLVPHFARQGKHVSTVDQYANMLIPGTGKIDGTLFSNGINHPNAVVYDRMAQTWCDGIKALNLTSSSAAASQ
jgi:lysophospholipase L1-like esterase